jgi:hypothetical protein
MMCRVGVIDGRCGKTGAKSGGAGVGCVLQMASTDGRMNRSI